MTPLEELKYHFRETYRSLGEPGAQVLFPRPQRFTPGPWEGHFHLRAELFLQRSATTRFQFPNQTLDLTPGQVLVVPSRVYHAEAVVAGEGPFRNVVLYADEANLSFHLADGTPKDGPQVAYPVHLGGKGCGQVASWLEDTTQVARDFPEVPEVAVGLVRSILALSLRLLDLPSAQEEAEPLTVVRCRRMIHEELGDPGLSVATLARRLGCSADYLSHLFRTVRGEKLTAYIEELRMLRAAELLSQTTLSCKEVAWASGYANQSYFIRCFGKRWGAPPLDWRQRPTVTTLPADREGGLAHLRR